MKLEGVTSSVGEHFRNYSLRPGRLLVCVNEMLWNPAVSNHLYAADVCFCSAMIELIESGTYLLFVPLEKCLRILDIMTARGQSFAPTMHCDV